MLIDMYINYKAPTTRKNCFTETGKMVIYKTFDAKISNLINSLPVSDAESLKLHMLWFAGRVGL